jgi:hypothetical protein
MNIGVSSKLPILVTGNDNGQAVLGLIASSLKLPDFLALHSTIAFSFQEPRGFVLLPRSSSFCRLFSFNWSVYRLLLVLVWGHAG